MISVNILQNLKKKARQQDNNMKMKYGQVHKDRTYILFVKKI